jgi:hypothetical protein
MTSPGNGPAIPAAFRRVGVPAGSEVRIRAKRHGTPASLVVESADGSDLLKSADGKLDIHCDPATLTEAAERFIIEVRALLHLDTGTADPHIRVRAADPRQNRLHPTSRDHTSLFPAHQRAQNTLTDDLQSA